MSGISDATQKALATQKQQSVKETRKKLQLALRRLVNGNPKIVNRGTKLTASSVAKEAGIDRVTVYRFHEPILTEIRMLNDSTTTMLLKENRSALAKTNIKLKEYRRLVEEAQEEVAALARINYRLDTQITELETMIRIRDEQISALLKQLNQQPSLKSKVSSLPK